MATLDEDIRYDRGMLAGLNAGWNYGASNDHDRMNSAVESLRRGIREARDELNNSECESAIRRLAMRLLIRAGLSEETADHYRRRGGRELQTALNVAFEILRHQRAFDANWLKDYYIVVGDHMVLTADGWAPFDDVVGCEILDEVNAPLITAERNQPQC